MHLIRAVPKIDESARAANQMLNDRAVILS
jgi:hypothetical protein